MTGEVTTLEHKLGVHTVEARSLVALAQWLVAERSEVLSSLEDLIDVEIEVDALSLS